LSKPDATLGSLNITRESIIRDYRIAYQSRQASLLGRNEVFAGKAKFGIFGDGKEVAQVAMARAFRKGDIRSGYYRDQTFMFALDILSIEEFFAQLYAHADEKHEPCSAGRSMTAHFATRVLDENGAWLRMVEMYNSSADVSPTGSQMPRLVGLGYASRLFRNLGGLEELSGFSSNGDEIAFGTIGNASCAEGLFWESINAIGVLQVPVLMSIWDDGYGISVPNEFQISGGHLTEVLGGFQRKEGEPGFDIHTVHGWDYPALCETYNAAAEIVRREHAPVLIHVVEMTQPQGHSTSGSHERYKDKERLAWEDEFDCLSKMREWMVAQEIATAAQLDEMQAEDKQVVGEAKQRAWRDFRAPIDAEREALLALLGQLGASSPRQAELEKISEGLRRNSNALRRDLMRAAADALFAVRGERTPDVERLIAWKDEQAELNEERYSSHLHSASAESALAVPHVEPVWDADAESVRGFEVLNAAFDSILGRYPQVVAFGQDVGRLGDVNQGFSGLQAKYGELRVSDAGIREATILGQAIGLAMRGFRPIVEIQYLDYLLYALQIISDDLATVRYRTKGGQKAPVVVRTRGHRLEGIWHSGSPMAGILNLVRGVYVCVPRDMTRAAGFYNTMLQSDDTALIVEVLNGYRIKERLPSNIDTLTTPLGVPELLRAGDDITVVTYGACCRIALDAAEQLARAGIEVELIDVQTLLPFDLRGVISESLKKTNRVVFLDEDVPGGATAFMMQQVIDEQGGYQWLDSPPRAVSARPHRPAYGSDGDYFSKPNREQVFRAVYELMHETEPARFPIFY
jgi:pyruvate/2-oxoglutarate/acetoin dehydrogenase E1 component/TPP-dependent pyruvate/acetoin dehydrogenase alpha subunit